MSCLLMKTFTLVYGHLEVWCWYSLLLKKVLSQVIITDHILTVLLIQARCESKHMSM